MKRHYLSSICLLVILILSAMTYVWLTSSSRRNQDAVVLKSYGSLHDAVQGILNGEVDLLPIDKADPQTLQVLQNSPNVRLIIFPSFDFTYIGLNLRNWPLNDSIFRKAMLYAFNRPGVLNQALGGLGRSLNSGLFSTAYSTVGWQVSNDTYGYDPAKAKVLLNVAGFNASVPFRIDPSTNKTLRTMFISSRLSQPAEVAAADFFAKAMQSVGLPIVSFPQSDIDFYLALRTYSFDIFVDSEHANAAPTWLYTLFSSENDVAPVPLGTNKFGFKNSTYDFYAKQVLTGIDQHEIRNAAEFCQEILAADLPVLPVFSKDLLIAARLNYKVTPITGSLSDTIRNSTLGLLQNPSVPLPLRIGFTSSFDDLNPTTLSNQADWAAFHLLTEPLLTTDQNGNLEAGLAQQWTVSTNGTFITVGLRQDARFDDGRVITVNDLATTLEWLIDNVRPSSFFYPIMNEIARVDILDQKTIRIVLATPNKLAIYSFIDLFALPEGRLTNHYVMDTLAAKQLLVSSGPLILRMFTQTDGVYLGLNNVFFGQPVQNYENIDVFEGETVDGYTMLPSSQIRISTQPLIVGEQFVRNASYGICLYDENDSATQCVSGNYYGYGTYAALVSIDLHFRIGTYRVESTLHGSLPNGTFVIFEHRTLTVRSLPIIQVALFIGLILVLVIIFRRREHVRSKRRIRRRARTTRRRPRLVRKRA